MHILRYRQTAIQPPFVKLHILKQYCTKRNTIHKIGGVKPRYEESVSGLLIMNIYLSYHGSAFAGRLSMHVYNIMRFLLLPRATHGSNNATPR